MPPSLAHIWQRRDEPATSNGEFYSQLVNPGDVFSVLLIMGPDVIGRALAQLAGSGLAPVTFSFGWVGYSICALMAAFGQNQLMPTDPDCKCKVINGANGYARENTSWILGRITRDFEYWRDPRAAQRTADVLEGKWKEIKRQAPNAKRPSHASLVISVYEPSKVVAAGTIKHDVMHLVGFLVVLLQLGIAAIPIGLFGDWGILVITIIGTILSFATGLLPQWNTEKWACRTNSESTYIITRGNGAQNAIVVLGNGHGFNLEDLASGQTNTSVATNTTTRAALVILFIFWTLLLILAAGIKQNTWFLLAVGGIGIIQNLYVAGYPRRPENFGIPLQFVKVFGHTKVMDTLLEAEKNYENLGTALLPEFFPGALTAEEERSWEEIRKSYGRERERQATMQMQTRGNITSVEPRAIRRETV